MSGSSSAPSYEELLVKLAERDALIVVLTARVETLSGRVAELELRLGKNSQNSSKPPSTDAFVKPPPRSLRRPSGRRPGKQTGDGGARLEPAVVPDEVVIHEASACCSCGLGLHDAPVVGRRSRQVFDLPPVRLKVTEHRVVERLCSCGQVNAPAFPDHVTAMTCYGPRVAAVGTYLMTRHHVPVARTSELMAQMLGAPVSTGWLSGLAARAAKRLEPFTDHATAALRSADVAHFDETGARVAGKLAWVHVACNDRFTRLHLARSRGRDSIGAGNILGAGFAGVAVHDGLNAYHGWGVDHGLCGAHHLRELAGIAELTGHGWPTNLADLLVELHVAVGKAKARGKTELSTRTLGRYRRRYRALLVEGMNLHPAPPPTRKQGRPRLGLPRALLRRLDLHQDDVLRFAYDFNVPFDNNQAERDVRMVKLQQKISGCWRTTTGAEAFLDIRSYLATAAKHHRDALDVLGELFTTGPWIPTPACPTP